MADNKEETKNTKNNVEAINLEKDELVDIVDEKEKESYEGKVIEVKDDIIYVHNITKKKDEKYKLDENKVLKQWKPTLTIQKYNLLDIQLGNTEYWVVGTVMDIDESNKKILVKYKNSNRYKKTCEEWIELDSDKMAPLHFYTKSEKSFNISDDPTNPTSSFNLPQSKLNSFSLIGKKTIHTSNNDSSVTLSQTQEEKFKEIMRKNNFEIREVRGDGNCLFRAVSDQIYGSDSHYEIVRQRCMDYLKVQKKYFELFIEDDFDEYIKEKRKNGVWGDDIELEVLSEIYNRPIEIYCGSANPSKCFHEEKQKNICDEGIVSSPIRLSYHGKNHYNSVIPLKNDEYKYQLYKNSLINSKPGIYEKKMIALAKDNEERLSKGIEISENEFLDHLMNNLCGEKKREILDSIILSLNSSDNNDKNILETENKNKKLKADNDNETIDSKNDIKDITEINNEKNEQGNFNLSADELLLSNPSVQNALDLGFTMQDITKALDVCGDDDKDSLINYLLNNKGE